MDLKYEISVANQAKYGGFHAGPKRIFVLEMILSSCMKDHLFARQREFLGRDRRDLKSLDRFRGR